jgi:SAM-dependent methyltransferase
MPAWTAIPLLRGLPSRPPGGRTMTEDWRSLNRANWDEWAGLHAGPRGYDLGTHRAGRGRLDGIVSAEPGDVAGLRVLHLQCHICHDSIAIAQRGAAQVMGVDFSPASIAVARDLAAALGVTNAGFVVSDLYAVPDALPEMAGACDLVFDNAGRIVRSVFPAPAQSPDRRRCTASRRPDSARPASWSAAAASSEWLRLPRSDDRARSLRLRR